MKTLQKGFISPLLLALIAVLLLGGGAYVYMQNKQSNQMPVPQDISSTDKQLPTASRILPNTYSDLTEYENALVKRMSLIGGPYNAYILKWYDDKTVVFIIAPPKDGGAVLGIYDIGNLKELSTLAFPLFGNTIESNSYIVATTLGGKDFIFYKKGATDFKTIPNAALPSSETYIKGNGNYDFTFDEPTKTLTASVFKEVKGSISNTKIRTVKFVLP